MNTTIEISGQKIGLDHPSYFIADIGANHDGDLEKAKDLIYLCAEAGADWIAATVNGIGERCGIVDTLQLLINLRLQGMTQREPVGEAIAAARDVVARAAGAPVSKQRAITGDYAFTHTSALHRQAMSRDSATYEAIDPDWIRAKPPVED